ncbi:hypothetical protein EB796_019647 [Bugula neritina]|uniref:Uncharacterized protein n=1 Tax=Bugula neritina TaxID=10212 RepID=A0A7J7J7Q2_BUGNE|nr:hypothetical protein EB796_019647 [Bugula neritina]
MIGPNLSVAVLSVNLLLEAYYLEGFNETIELSYSVEEEMELIEQDFLEAMFDDLLREEDERESYYGPPDEYHDQQPNAMLSWSMQLPKVRQVCIIFE